MNRAKIQSIINELKYMAVNSFNEQVQSDCNKACRLLLDLMNDDVLETPQFEYGIKVLLSEKPMLQELPAFDYIRCPLHRYTFSVKPIREWTERNCDGKTYNY